MGHAAATSDHNCLAKINPTILRNADFIGTTCTSADGALAGEALAAAPIDEQTRTLRGLGRLEGALQVAAVAIQCWAVDTVCNARAIAGSAMVSRGDALDLLGGSKTKNMHRRLSRRTTTMSCHSQRDFIIRRASTSASSSRSL
jgi:hypothetical protein